MLHVNLNAYEGIVYSASTCENGMEKPFPLQVQKCSMGSVRNLP